MTDILSFARLKAMFEALTVEQQVIVVMNYCATAKQELISLEPQGRFRIIATKLLDDLKFQEISARISSVRMGGSRNRNR